MIAAAETEALVDEYHRSVAVSVVLVVVMGTLAAGHAVTPIDTCNGREPPPLQASAEHDDRAAKTARSARKTIESPLFDRAGLTVSRPSSATDATMKMLTATVTVEAGTPNSASAPVRLSKQFGRASEIPYWISYILTARRVQEVVPTDIVGDDGGKQLAPRRPVVRPEIQLLYMAKAMEAKNAQDFDVARPRLDRDAASWLADALATTLPEHPWLMALR